MADCRKNAERIYGGRLSAADLSAPDAGLLEKLKLVEGKYLKRAAVLLFHEDPDRFITGAFVKIGYFVSESDLAYHDEIHGSLFSQAHASHPYNPDVANAFFRSGEIESWGRGIEKIFSACRKADSPPPDIHLDGYDLWMEFVFSPQYMAVIQGETDSKKSATQKTIQKTAQKILYILKNDPEISRAKIAEQLGDITESGVKYHLAKMKWEGLICRVGPDKGGHWEVLK